jgi:methyl-galactoside transport system substrate-binding protein
MQAQIVLDLCSTPEELAKYDWNGDGKLQYVMLEGEAGHQDALLRTEYSVNTIMEGGIPMEKLGDEIANWSRAQAQTKTNLWLSEFGDEIELVLANNDDMALGVIDAYKESGRTKWPMILGIDGLDEAVEAVEEGTMTGTVVNDAAGQSQSMLELAYSLVCGTPLPDDITLEDDTYIRLPHRIVTKESK